jgi:hypothetical protein
LARNGSAHQLRSLGFTPLQELHPTRTDTPQEYITSRMRETHDIVHVLTGFGVDPASERPLADWQRQLGLPVEGDGPQGVGSPAQAPAEAPDNGGSA